MSCKVTNVQPMTPILVTYEENGQQRQNLFFLEETGSLLPGFARNAGPQDLHSFNESFTKYMKKRNQEIAKQYEQEAVRQNPLVEDPEN